MGRVWIRHAQIVLTIDAICAAKFDGTVQASFVELDPELVTALAARNAERMLPTPVKGS